jgi:GT2 family glycosyltransferase
VIPVLIVPVLNRPDLLMKMLLSIDTTIGQLIVIDNGDVVDVEGPLTVIKPGHNLGVAASWNLGMRVTPTAPWWCIANSDLEFGEGDLERLADQVDPGIAGLYFMLGMAAFGLTRATVNAVGYFDENFYPAYDEDLDYGRRADLLGLPRFETGFTGTHVGSATIYSDPVLRIHNGRTHSANDEYYAAKWGGHKEGGETFSTPFNKGGHVGDWRLDPERLRNQVWQ